MSDLIRELRRDHGNLAALLDLLDVEITRSAEGSLPDLDLMGRVVDYFRNYPDLCHHPKEDLIYRRLALRSPALAASLGDLLAEHGRLAQLARTLTTAIHHAARDLGLWRDCLESVARDYADALRRHIDAEEHELFPAALATLTEADWQEIEREIRTPDDPVFDHAVQARYPALEERLLRVQF